MIENVRDRINMIDLALTHRIQFSTSITPYYSQTLQNMALMHIRTLQFCCIGIQYSLYYSQYQLYKLIW